MKKSLTYHFSFVLLIGLLGYLFIGLFPRKVLADFSLGVFPPIVQITATPPSAIKQPITIVNQSDTPVSLAIQFKPFTQSDSEDGHVRYLGPDESIGADPRIFQKMQLLDGDSPITTLDLSAKEQKTLTLHIGLPKNEPPSDYYFSILFVTNANTVGQVGSGLSGSIATNVLLSVGPQGKAIGFLNTFSSPLFVSGGPVPFTVKVNNLSPFFIVPRGQILIHNLFGQLVGKVDLLPVNILSNTMRYIPGGLLVNGKWSMANNDGAHAIWNEAFLFGPYAAHMTIALSPTGPIYHKTIYFFAMPWQYLIGFFIAAVLVSIVVVRVRKRLKR